MSVPVIARVHYYAPDSQRRAFYSSSSSNDYVSYIDKGIDSGRGADRDYMDYMSNPDKSTGVFSGDGILSFEEKKQLRNMLRNAKGNIWDLVISLDGDLGKERLSSCEQAQSMLKSVLPKLFGKMGLSKGNVVWYAGLHTNTDNRHVHVSFFEKESTFYNQQRKEYRYRKGRISNEYIRELKCDVEEYLFSDKEEEKARRKKLMEELSSSVMSFDDDSFPPFLRSEVRFLMQAIPTKGRHSYMSLDTRTREHVDRISKAFLYGTESGKQILAMLDDMREKESKTAKRYGVKKKPNKADRIEADIYRRIGNRIVDRIIQERNEAFMEFSSIRSDNLRRKNEMRKIDFLVSKIKRLSDEERKASEEYFHELKKKAEKEILEEKGLIDEAEL